VNLADLVRATAERLPDKPALLFQNQALSFGELDERIDLTAAALAGLGVGRGDRVAVLAGNVPEFVYALYGSMRTGAAANPLNVMLTPEEIAYILADSGARAAVVELPYLTGLLSVRDRLADLETVLVIGGPPAPAGTISLEEALRTAGDPPEIEVGPGDLAVLAYTAGTTAEPKGAMLTHGNLTANLDQMAAVPALAEAETDIVLLALPLYHIYGLNVGLGLTMKMGATAVLVERFDPFESLQQIERHGVTVLFGAPQMFSAWLGAARGDDAADRFRTVRLAASGAAPLPAEVLEAFRERFGVTIWEGYGLTETAPAVTTNALGPAAKPRSIGLPLPGVDVRLVDDEGQDVEAGDPGEVWVRGPNVFAGYWNRPDATATALEGEWLKTGDVAVRGEDGYLTLVDRKKDLIIVSGFNVYPREVEDAIESHPNVAEAAVVGIPDDRTGEAVQAWVVPAAGQSVSTEDVLDHLRGYVARFKLPKDVQVVEDLPHHVTGKVLRRMLRPEPEG
jgi:long-chain acyl-CoA synthetase